MLRNGPRKLTPQQRLARGDSYGARRYMIYSVEMLRLEPSDYRDIEAHLISSQTRYVKFLNSDISSL